MKARKTLKNIKDLINWLRTQLKNKSGLKQVAILFKLLLVVPATNAVSERSFSAMKRVKSYLRATMTDNRLNHLMTIHIHKHLTDEMNLLSIANQFMEVNDVRLKKFGKFF